MLNFQGFSILHLSFSHARVELHVSSCTAYESGYGAVHVFTPLNPIGTMAKRCRAAYVLQRDGRVREEDDGGRRAPTVRRYILVLSVMRLKPRVISTTLLGESESIGDSLDPLHSITEPSHLQQGHMTAVKPCPDLTEESWHLTPRDQPLTHTSAFTQRYGKGQRDTGKWENPN